MGIPNFRDFSLNQHLCKMNINPGLVSDELHLFLESFLQENRKSRFEEILSQRTRHLTIAMENVADEHNINAVIRSAECFGLQDIHIIDNGSRFKPARSVVRGSHKWVNVFKHDHYENNTLPCIQNLRKKGYRIVATSSHKHQCSISELSIDKPLALFLGQESAGFSPILEANADEFVIIPMQGFTESFNMSVAGAVMLYELSNRIRASSQIDWHLKEDEKQLLRKSWTLKTLKKPELLIEHFYSSKGIENPFKKKKIIG